MRALFTYGAFALALAACSPAAPVVTDAALPSPSLATPPSASPGAEVVSFADVKLSFKRDDSFTSFDVYRTDLFAVESGALAPFDSGLGHFGFSAIVGAGSGRDGYSIDGVDTSTQEDYRTVRFTNLGAKPYAEVLEAPEYGYNSPLPGRRSVMDGVSAGNVIVFKIDDKNSKTTFGKLFLKDLTGSQVVFDYLWQRDGSRKFQ